MEYLAVEWKHNLLDMPVEIYSELDARRMEVRKVEVFKGGTLGYASASRSKESTKLGIEAVPTFHEIASQAEFKPRQATSQEFEKLWASATQRGRL